MKASEIRQLTAEELNTKLNDLADSCLSHVSFAHV